MGRWLPTLCLVLGCSRASQEGEAKQWATSPPARDIPIPANLSIAITVDGSARPSITGQHLRGAKPDFADDEHKAWLIPTLVPEAGLAGNSGQSSAGSPAGGSAGSSAGGSTGGSTGSSAGSWIEAMSGAGVSVKFARPAADGREPVLFLTRRGDVIVSALDPKDPFPRFHGQGGRLRRAGDSTPRVSPVARIEITHTRP